MGVFKYGSQSSDCAFHVYLLYCTRGSLYELALLTWIVAGGHLPLKSSKSTQSLISQVLSKLKWILDFCCFWADWAVWSVLNNFYNFKFKVLKYPRNCRLHSPLILNLVKPLICIPRWKAWITKVPIWGSHYSKIASRTEDVKNCSNTVKNCSNACPSVYISCR